MIGSSLDGIDVMDVSINLGSEDNYHIHNYREFPLTESIKKGVLAHKALDQESLVTLGKDLAKLVGKYLLQNFSKGLETIDIIGFHGITLLHLPDQKITIQLGCGQTLASIVDVPVVTNFRNEDLLAGGEGTPMAPIVEKYFFPDIQYFLNLGGIANISIHDEEGIKAFDVCPFNQVLNHFSRKELKAYDDSGHLAQSGQVNEFMLNRLSSVIFFFKSPPKSLDNNWITEHFIPALESYNLSSIDVLATLTEFFALDIAKWIGDSEHLCQMMITGGGAKNTYFIDCLRTKLKAKNVNVIIPNKMIVDGKEALLIALAAVLKQEELPNFVSSVTGANKDVSGGTINYPW
jgi:anhydro-N-acetylmuramic acid kinase